MKESILNVQLIKRLVKDSSKGQEKANRGDLSKRRKCITIIKAKNLSVSFGNKVILMLINLAARTNLTV